MKHAARVIIQTVTYNSAHTIKACISSVLKQRYPDILFVIIDNASTDNTLAIVKRLGVRVVSLPENIGYAAAHNIGIRRFKSDYVLTLNPDITLDRDFVGNVVKAMDKEPRDTGSAQGLLYRVERLGEKSDTVDSMGVYMNPARRQNLRNAGKQVQNHMREPEYIFGPDGAAALYRRTMLEDISLGNGVFDEDFFMHKEDVDVCWRAQLRGWKSVFVPDAVGHHVRTFRPGQRTVIASGLRIAALRNRYYLMVKNDTFLLWLRDLPWIFLYDLGIFFYVLLRERGSLVSYTQVVNNFRSLLAKRAAIQRSRKAGTVYMAQWFMWRQA